jgi:hypothetical protein
MAFSIATLGIMSHSNMGMTLRITVFMPFGVTISRMLILDRQETDTCHILLKGNLFVPRSSLYLGYI